MRYPPNSWTTPNRHDSEMSDRSRFLWDAPKLLDFLLHIFTSVVSPSYSPYIYVISPFISVVLITVEIPYDLPICPQLRNFEAVTRWMTEPSTISNRPSSRCRRCSWPNFSRNDVWGLSGVSEKRPFGAGQFPSIIYSIHIYRYIIYIYIYILLYYLYIYIYYTCPTSPPFTDLFFNCHV